ncbi:MAG: DUF2897 family protein [Thalassotalea sp.]
MDISIILIIVFTIGFIASGIILLKQSAKKFHLTDQQQKDIKQRAAEQKLKDQAQNKD